MVGLGVGKFCDYTVEITLIFLIIFSTLAYGGVEYGFISLMEFLVIIMLLAWIAKMFRRGKISFIHTPLNLPLLIFILLNLLYLLPLPKVVIDLVSPNANILFSKFSSGGTIGVFVNTLSLYPDNTKKEFLQLLTYILLFFVIVNNINKQEQIERIIIITSVFSFVIAIWGILQQYTFGSKIYWFQDWVLSGKPFGPYINKNHFAGHMLMVIPFLIANFIYARRLEFKLLSCFMAAIMMVALFISLSRGGWLSLIVSCIFLSMIFSVKKTLKTKAWIIPLMLGLTIVFLVLMGIDPVTKRLATVFSIEEFSRSRVNLWINAMNVFRDFPIFGVGLGGFSHIFPAYKTIGPNIFFKYVENEYIQLLVELGVIGFALAIWAGFVYFSHMLTMWRLRHERFVKKILIGSLAGSIALSFHLLTNFNLHVPSNTILFITIVSIGYVVAQRHFESDRK